ncbi:VOC family protein [Rhodopseudomonas sp. HC1]|uniref:VOC family protein n=1 Tax=Rhodopseudomonas infernalis TaxID=2897386 RepID=UPI001EE9AD1F|nr:VOC family protein [Rhodopseudomonas infernalis]MCG6206176.1 VOC family protein [Rhodopseudomonas infernalis]
MAPFLRLRQICLVTEPIEPAASQLAAILGLNICYRDPHVGKYGLENVLLPVDTTLLEIVAPTQPGTAAGRFLDKTGGRGGYMAIFCCDDPDARGRHAASLGVRTANVIDHAPYHGVQLHPRDCRAAFIELNHTEGSDNIRGPYPPAGADWDKAIRTDTTQALTAVEMQSPDPADLAAHWGRILDLPVSTGADDAPELKLPNATFRFVQGVSEAMTALTLEVADVAKVRDAAKAQGVTSTDDGFNLAGVEFKLTT